MSVKKNVALGWIAAIAVAIMWGVTGVVAKPLTHAIDPLTLVFFRYVTAVTGLLVIFSLTRKNTYFNKEMGSSLKIDKKDIALIVFTGIVGQGCYSLFNFLSLYHIGATENGVIQGMQPFATVFFGMMFMNFRMNKIQWAAFILCAICIYAMSAGPSSSVDGGNELKGYLFVTLSMLSLGWTAYLRQKLALKYGSVVAMLHQYIAVAIAGLGMVFFFRLDLSQVHIILASPLLIFLMIFLGTCISGGSYLIQLYSFKQIGVENSTMALNLMPLVGYVVAVMALGEEVSMVKTVSVLLIVVALYLFTRSAGSKQEASKKSTKTVALSAEK